MQEDTLLQPLSLPIVDSFASCDTMTYKEWYYLEQQRQSWVDRDNRFSLEYENELDYYG